MKSQCDQLIPSRWQEDPWLWRGEGSSAASLLLKPQRWKCCEFEARKAPTLHGPGLRLPVPTQSPFSHAGEFMHLNVGTGTLIQTWASEFCCCCCWVLWDRHFFSCQVHSCKSLWRECFQAAGHCSVRNVRFIFSSFRSCLTFPQKLFGSLSSDIQ